MHRFTFRMRPLALSIHLMLAATVGVSLLHINTAKAQSTAPADIATFRVDIPAGPLTAALNSFANETGIALSFDPRLTAGKVTESIRGTYSADRGLALLLQGSGLSAVRLEGNSYTLRQTPVSSIAPRSQADVLPAVEVKGVVTDDAARPYAGGQVARGARLGMLGNVSTMDTPFNTTAYTAELIENQQARNIIDVLANDPSVADAGGRNFDNFFMRGFVINREEIGFDGLYGIASAEGNMLQGIERVEVLKGPSTMINGASPRGASGGSINLVPKRAGDTPLTRLTGTYLNDGNLGTHLDLGRRFGTNNEFGVRVNMAYRDGDSPIDGEKQRASLLTAGLDYKGDRFRVSGDFGSSRQRIDQDKPTFLVSSPVMPEAPSGKRNVAQPWNYQDKEHDFAMLKGELDLSDSLVLGLVYGQAESRRDRVDAFPSIDNAQGDISSGTYGLRSKTRTHSGEASLRWKVKTGSIAHQLVLNASNFQSRVSEFQPSVTYTYTTNLYNPIYLADPGGDLFNGTLGRASNTQMRSYGIADTLSMFDDRLLVTLGVRHQSIEVNNFNSSTGERTGAFDRSKVTPALAVVFKQSPTMSLYANYVEALARGNVPPAAAVNRNEVFPPFVSKQHEIGVKNEWGNWSTTVSAFQIERPAGLLQAGNIYRIDGEQRNRGLEFQAFGEPMKGWRVLGGAAWTNARLLKTQDGETDGRQAAGSPRWQVRMGSEWDIRPVPGLTTSARIFYTSSQPVKADNSIRIPSWTRLDVGARYATKIGGRPVLLRAVIENVTDRRYWDAVPDFWVVSSAAPRTFLLSASVDF